MTNPVAARDLVGLAAEVPASNAEHALLQEGRALSFSSTSNIKWKADKSGVDIATSSTVDGVEKQQTAAAFSAQAKNPYNQNGVQHYDRNVVVKPTDGLPSLMLTDLGVDTKNSGRAVGSVIQGDANAKQADGVDTNVCIGQFDASHRLTALDCTGEAERTVDGKEYSATTKSHTTLTYPDAQPTAWPTQNTSTQYIGKDGQPLGTINQTIAFTDAGATEVVKVTH